MPDAMMSLTPHLSVYRAAVNVGIVHDGNRRLCIDCATGVVATLKREQAAIDAILFTHHHRDQLCGAHGPAAQGTTIMAPAAERRWFDDVAAFWNDPAYRWHLYQWHPHHFMAAEPLRVDRALADGDTVTWGPATITALATPGHTDGGMTYLVDVDGQRIAFTGDLIAAPGRLHELYSLQAGHDMIGDYHGFLGARGAVLHSLRAVLAAEPALLVPSHGEIMRDPAGAVAALDTRLRACYDQYAAISALRWYFPTLFADYADDPRMMPIRAVMPAPSCLRHVGTSWMLRSSTGAVLVMDCGSTEVIDTVRQWQAAGEIGAVEGLWITHYHDDHVDAAAAFQQAFDCELLVSASFADVLAHPIAWRLPCISPHPVRVDRALGDGERWRWHEFTLTAYDLPGQSLYHGGLLVEGQGLRMFFAGDSFTPAGIDDYCAPNRNFLGEGVGFDRCLTLLETLKPTMLFNAHVDVAFNFTAEEYRVMHANLAAREREFAALLAWEHPNYGMDEFWAHAYPYEQTARPGSTVTLALRVTNHSDVPREARCRLVPPTRWPQAASTAASVIPAREVARLPLPLAIPADAAPGRYVVTIDLEYHDRRLPQCAEAIIVIR